MCFNGEIGQCFSAVDRIARKERTCVDCERIIGRGEQYRDSSGVWDGQWQHFPQCMACVEIVEMVVAHERAMGCRGNNAYPPFGEALAAWSDIEADNDLRRVWTADRSADVLTN